MQSWYFETIKLLVTCAGTDQPNVGHRCNIHTLEVERGVLTVCFVMIHDSEVVIAMLIG